MIPKFRVWLPDTTQMLRVKALVFEKIGQGVSVDIVLIFLLKMKMQLSCSKLVFVTM